jgi:hypothetical protein
MTMIDRRDPLLPVSLRQSDDARIDLIERKVLVPPTELGHSSVIAESEIENLELSRRDAVEPAQVRLRPVAAEKKDRRFGYDWRGDCKLPGEASEELSAGVVLLISGNQCRNDRAGVADEH